MKAIRRSVQAADGGSSTEGTQPGTEPRPMRVIPQAHRRLGKSLGEASGKIMALVDRIERDGMTKNELIDRLIDIDEHVQDAAGHAGAMGSAAAQIHLAHSQLRRRLWILQYRRLWSATYGGSDS